jgi:hypothetical protein
MTDTVLPARGAEDDANTGLKKQWRSSRDRAATL